MIWSSVQVPIPLPSCGVMFGARQVPNASGTSIPPAYSRLKSGPLGPIGMWQNGQPRIPECAVRGIVITETAAS